MSTLTTKQRKAMPQSEYALPGKRFPLNDVSHDEAALRDAQIAQHAGSITPAQAALVRRKAHAALAKHHHSVPKG